jgi:hypothetical protein
MRIRLILYLLSYCMSSFAVTDPEVKELFTKYDQVMDRKKIELIDEVFSKKFIKESGGKKELISKINSLPVPLVESKSEVSWKESTKGKFYLARYKETSAFKSSTGSPETEFILVKENGYLKIDGTISDGH